MTGMTGRILLKFFNSLMFFAFNHLTKSVLDTMIIGQAGELEYFTIYFFRRKGTIKFVVRRFP
jgi:hypothetical protein